MFESMRSAKGSKFMKTLTAIYYISWIFIGNFILLNLFLAILIDSFNSEEDDTKASVDEDIEAEKRSNQLKAQRLEELKNKRRKKLGALKNDGNGLQRTLTSSIAIAKKKVITFTGVNK